MSDYLEAMLLLLPADAGGRSMPICPREGSYRPFARIGSKLSRVRVIEGPPLLAPGDEARVMAEVECDAGAELHAGAEIQLLENDEQYVGVMTVVRVCRGAVTA